MSTLHETEFVTVEEAAAMLRVHSRTIRNRIRDGVLPARRLRGSRKMLIERKDVLTLLEVVLPPVEMEGIVPPGESPRSVGRDSPLISRLHTPEGRARALDALRALDTDDEEEQRETGRYLIRALDEDRLSHRKLFP